MKTRFFKIFCLLILIITSFLVKNVFLFGICFSIFLNMLKLTNKIQFLIMLLFSVLWFIIILKVPINYVLLWIPIIPNIHIVLWSLIFDKGVKDE